WILDGRSKGRPSLVRRRGRAPPVSSQGEAPPVSSQGEAPCNPPPYAGFASEWTVATRVLTLASRASRLYFSYVAHENAATFSVRRGRASVYAVVRSGGRSYRVEEGALVTVGRRAGDVGSTITFDDVLLVADGVRIRAG